MNTRVSSVLAIMIVILIAGIAGGVIYQKNSSQVQEKKSAALDKGGKKINPPGTSLSKETVLIEKSDGTYEVDLVTKKTSLVSNIDSDLATFTGLPKETDTIANSVAILSHDKSQALVISATLDSSGENNMVSANEFICRIAEKSCVASDVMSSAHKAAGKNDKWFDDQSIEWHNWDSAKNVLYGYSNDDSGSLSPVFIYNIGSKVLNKTAGNAATVPGGTFSPSLGKFAIVDDSFSDKWDLLIYSTGELSQPLKKIDISSIIDKNDDANVVGSVAWSQDEKSLALATGNQIYLIELENGGVSLKYTDMVEDAISEESLQGIDSSLISFSSSGKYVVFVSYENKAAGDSENSVAILKAIDLKDANNVIEILKQDEMNLR